MLRSTFLAAEEAIEKKKAQVRLAEAEAQRDRQQLELQWRRLQWQQETLSEEFSNALQKALSNCPPWIQPMIN
eukprot:symbB.v1.2.002474.t1/scaffold99.1/size346285/30